jgi:hypothetical protein
VVKKAAACFAFPTYQCTWSYPLKLGPSKDEAVLLDVGNVREVEERIVGEVAEGAMIRAIFFTQKRGLRGIEIVVESILSRIQGNNLYGIDKAAGTEMNDCSRIQRLLIIKKRTNLLSLSQHLQMT